jgi:hypothetical protein
MLNKDKKHGKLIQNNSHISKDQFLHKGSSFRKNDINLMDEKNKKFITKARLKHGAKYDYSKSVYQDSQTKLIIICNKHGHGEFLQSPNSHLSGSGCPSCYKTVKLTQEEFEAKSNAIHHNKYDYSKAVYRGSNHKIIIICAEHKEFEQRAHNHMNGSNCPKCVKQLRITPKIFESKSKAIYGSQYDYSHVIFRGMNNLVAIVCNKHGPFKQSPIDHLSGLGCPLCCTGSIH